MFNTKKILNKQTIIQSTLAKITIILFIFMIMFILSTENLFWNNIILNLKNQSLTTESSIEEKLDNKLRLVNEIKKREGQRKQVKEQEINAILEPILKIDNNTICGYYDQDLGTNFPLNIIDLKSFNRMISDKQTNISWFNNGSYFYKKSVYYNGTIIGYIWLYIHNTNILYEPFELLSLTVISLLFLSAMIIVLVRRYLKDIQFYLESFTKMIIHQREDIADNHLLLKKLPELKPLINRISYYTENLKQTNLELESERLRIERILEGITDGFLSLDNDGYCTYINRVGRELFNNKTIIGLNFWESCPEISGTKTELTIRQAMKERDSHHWEDVGFGNVHQFYEYHAYPFEDGVSIFFQDITELKKQQNELGRLERLNLIGQLAAGIGHEIRNPLTSVRGFLQLFSSKPTFEDHKEIIDLMISEIDRANLIITDFLSLSKVKVEDAKCQNVNDIIYNIFPLLQADAFNNNKEVRLNLNEIADTLLDKNEIKQLLLNLVRNGLEATHTGGNVTISTLQEPTKIVLAIRDDGPGIPPEFQKKIGTPFFTTKDTGTGLGLAMSQSIAQRHNASFEFETGKNGTTFFIKFPKTG